jgi:hypothetical protein
MLVSYHITMWCHNPEEYDLILHCHENPRFCIQFVYNIMLTLFHKLSHMVYHVVSWLLFECEVSVC